MDLTKYKGKCICVAVSGGIDSVSLLHYMQNLQNEFGYVLSAVHCQHGIRGEESVEDMRFVQRLCQEQNIPLTVFETDCIARAKQEKISLETVARKFRYESFATLIRQNKADYVAVAHHKNDEAETVLFRLARGTSLTGARGMTEEKAYILRPFLSWSRRDVEAYAKEHGLEYREDSTNACEEFTRNKLRLSVLPALEEAIPGVVDNLARFAITAGEDDAYLYNQSNALLSKQKNGWLVAFSDEKPLYSRACLTALKSLGVEKDYTRLHLDLLFDLQGKQRGATLNMPKNVCAQKTLKGVWFYVEQPLPVLVSAPKYYTADGFDGGRYEVKIFFDKEELPNTPLPVLRVDADKIPKTAMFRFRKDGDYMRVFGGKTKSLKKLFNERKTDVKDRTALPIIADEKEVYVVCGVEISDQVKVTDKTKKVAYIAVIEK